MNRSTYLSQPPVQKFIEWMIPIVTGRRSLSHTSNSCKLGEFSCQTLHDAFTQYEWGGRDFNCTEKLLDGFRPTLRDPDVMPDGFKKAVTEVLNWGSMNLRSFYQLGDEAPSILREKAKLLDPKHADLSELSGFRYMSAGYSKIYSLMLDDFPIYDSRVACALTSLIHLFSNEESQGQVPCELRLGVPPGRGDNRNPYGFPAIKGARYTLHAVSNVKAAWLLGELAVLGEFGKLPANRRVSALQAALFMIGYKPLSQNALGPALKNHRSNGGP